MRHISMLTGVLLSLLLVTASASAQDTAPPASRRSSVQLAFQGRLDAMGYLAPRNDADPRTTNLLSAIQTITPYVTPGVRLIDGRLFLGIGIGFGSYSYKQCQDTCDDYDLIGQSYFALSPMAFFDVLRSGPASLYAGGWFSFAPIGAATFETHRGATTNITETDSASAIGFNLAVGIRAQLVEGLSLGTEWGWGLTSYSSDGSEPGVARDVSTTMHGIFGTLMLEGAINL